jgi:hypothetical protein
MVFAVQPSLYRALILISIDWAGNISSDEASGRDCIQALTVTFSTSDDHKLSDPFIRRMFCVDLSRMFVSRLGPEELENLPGREKVSINLIPYLI